LGENQRKRGAATPKGGENKGYGCFWGSLEGIRWGWGQCILWGSLLL